RAEIGKRLRAYTAATVTSPATLIRQLVAIRERGYSVVAEELEPGLTAIAAPLRNAHGDVIASLSVSGAAVRYDAAMIDSVIRAVTSTASAVSARLGWHSEASAASTDPTP